jgi:hypothetical protein
MFVNLDVGAMAGAIVALCTLGNTALLVWHSRQLVTVRRDVNGAKIAAVNAAQQAGYVRGVIDSTRPPGGRVPYGKEGESPTPKSG